MIIRNTSRRWFHLFIFFLALSPLAQARSGSTDDLSVSMRKLLDHINEESILNATEVNEQTVILQKNMKEIGSSPRIIGEALALSATYESKKGPLFINKATEKGFKRQPSGGLELERAIFAVQQGIIDYVYTPDNLRQHTAILDGAAFKTSSYFPGAVDAPKNPKATYNVKVDASQPVCWGIPVMNTTDPARRPTGCYLAPGSMATVTVPHSMVGKGFSIRVGAHSWDLKKKPKVKRLDRVSIVYPIDQIQTRIANPLGGGIYIEVPYEADAGVVQIQIANAVRSPFFSARNFDKTTLEEWKTERLHPGPWTDFESDKFMMQVPTSWVYAYDDPATLMKDWDAALDAVSKLFGYPLVRNKTVLYVQVDVIFRGSANFPGYPQSNTPYKPGKKETGHSDHWLLKGPQYGAGGTTFHETGHSQLFTKFKGETEAVVNLPYVAVMNTVFGADLARAYGLSFRKESLSLDQAATMWMVTENFRAGNPMDISRSDKNEVRYQQRGYGRYVEIANLFGWEVLQNFWQSVNEDYIKGIKYSRNSDPTDSRILRLSQKAGVELTPLIHFWGVQPEDAALLKKEMEQNGLKPSALIYDRLVHYKSKIPMDNSAFRTHAHAMHPKQIREGKTPNNGEGWYFFWLSKYNVSHGAAAQTALQDIINIYFPYGRP